MSDLNKRDVHKSINITSLIVPFLFFAYYIPHVTTHRHSTFCSPTTYPIPIILFNKLEKKKIVTMHYDKSRFTNNI